MVCGESGRALQAGISAFDHVLFNTVTGDVTNKAGRVPVLLEVKHLKNYTRFQSRVSIFILKAANQRFAKDKWSLRTWEWGFKMGQVVTGQKKICSLQCATSAFEAAVKDQISFWDVSKNTVACKTEEWNYSALLATGEGSVEVLYPMWGIALKDRCIPTGDNPKESSRIDQFLTHVAKEELASFLLIKKKGRKKGDNDSPSCKSLL